MHPTFQFWKILATIGKNPRLRYYGTGRTLLIYTSSFQPQGTNQVSSESCSVRKHLLYSPPSWSSVIQPFPASLKSLSSFERPFAQSCYFSNWFRSEGDKRSVRKWDCRKPSVQSVPSVTTAFPE